MSIKILTDDLKKNVFSSLYYIYGEEEYLKDFYYNELKTKCATELAEFNVIEFDAKNFDYLDFTNCVNSYPVMADKKFVGVLDLDNTLFKKDFTKSFIDFLKMIPDYCTVVFLDTEMKAQSGTNHLEKAVASANGVVAKVDPPSNSSLVNWVARHFKKNKKIISSDNINYMLTIADTDMRSLSNEISKLCSYSSLNEITRDDIDNVVTKSIEANRFEISDAFCNGNYFKVIDILEKMYKQNVDDILIVNVFYRAFCDLWKAKLALNIGKTSADIARDFGLNPYAASKIMKNARSLDFKFLQLAIELSKKLDTNLKGFSYGNKKDIIIAYIADVVRRRNAYAKAKN